ncbi:hypothetical protein ACFSQ3_08030 [Sphingobacterium corticis]|uniref:Uncharacterized protein n=1 Tax=Sphingobacterium corticis TaxID=1812823 RepID=A0ABW5NIZ9_9SPHI
MIHKTNQTSLKAEQAGQTSYEYYDVQSDKTNLSGSGMYVNGGQDVGAWCEVDKTEGKFFVNKSLNLENEQMVLGNFADYCKLQYPGVKFTEFERVEVVGI